MWNGDIEHNSIIFNQSINPTLTTYGGGLSSKVRLRMGRLRERLIDLIALRRFRMAPVPASELTLTCSRATPPKKAAAAAHADAR